MVVGNLALTDDHVVREQAADRLAQSQTRTATALIAVYKAVSGGWPDRTPREVATGRD